MSPSWLSEIRTHAHTRLSPPDSYCEPDPPQNKTWTCKPVFNETASLFSSIGVRAYVRHTHMGADMDWWPSATGPAEAREQLVRDTGRNLPQEFIDHAHAEGVRLVGYHYPRCHKYYEKNASLLSRDHDGNSISDPRGLGLCVNSEWGDIHIAQLQELVMMGIDGIYIDEYSYIPTGCWCEHCRKRFLEENGEPMPQPSTPESFRKVLEFATAQQQRFYDRAAAAIANASEVARAKGLRTDDAIPFFSTHFLPCADAGGELFETLRLVRTAPVHPKIEFDTGASGGCLQAFEAKDSRLERPSLDALIAWGWVSNRDAASGRSGHMWYPSTTRGSEFVAAAQGAILTYGNIANLDHKESEIPNRTLFGPAYNLSARLEPLLNNTMPRRHAVVVFPSEQRNRFVKLSRSAPTGWGNDTQVWSKVMLPVVGLFESLISEGIPVGVASDWQLEPEGPEGDITRGEAPPPGLSFGGPAAAIVTPGANLTQAQKEGLAAFRASGGAVINASQISEDPMAWATAQERAKLGAEVIELVEKAVGPPPVRIQGGQDPRRDGPFHAQVLAVPGEERSSQLLMLSNSFHWAGERAPPSEQIPPPPVKGAQAVVALNSAGDVRAYDFIRGMEPLPVSIQGSTATVQLRTFDHSMIVKLECSQGCFR